MRKIIFLMVFSITIINLKAQIALPVSAVGNVLKDGATANNAAVASSTTTDFKLAINGAVIHYGTGINTVTSPTIYLGNSTATTGRIYGFNSNNTGLFSIGYSNGSTSPITLTNRFVIDSAGKIGIGISTPTAWLHLNAGSTAIGTAPFKFTSGPATTTPEIGAMHFTNGLLMLDSSNTKRDTMATRGWVRYNYTADSTVFQTKFRSDSARINTYTAIAGLNTAVGLKASTTSPNTFTALNTFQGTAASDGALLGSELAAVTGSGTNWALAGTNLNVGGYTHTAGSAVDFTTALAATSATYYQIVYTITRTTGSITVNYGGTVTSGITASGATGPLTASTAVLTITPTSDFVGNVALSIKVIGSSSAITSWTNSAGTIQNEVHGSSSNTNFLLGLGAGRRITTATANTAIGNSTLNNNTTGIFNTAIGYNALTSNTTGSTNTAIGYGSLSSSTTTNSGTAIGYLSLSANTTGFANTAVGNQTLVNNTTGGSNIAIGNSAGRFISGGVTANTIVNNSIFIGPSAYPLADNQTNQIAIGYSAIGDGSNTTVLGNSSTISTKLFGQLKLPAYGVGAKIGTPSYALQVDASGNIIEGTVSSGAVTAIGATNYLQKVTGTTTLGNTLVYDNGASVGINNASPSASALLDIASTTKGILLPKVTQAQMNAIASPASGLMVINTDSLNRIFIYNGTTWRGLTFTNEVNGWSLTGNSGTTWNTKFVGTIDNNGLWFKTNNILKAGFDTSGHFQVLDTVSLLKPVVFTTPINQLSPILLAYPSGQPFPWFKIDATAYASRILMTVNNVNGSEPDMLRIVASYTDSITTGTYRPLIVKTYDYAHFWSKYGGGSDSIFRVSSIGETNFTLIGRTNGKWQLPKYGVGTFTGTPTYTLQVDASGNIIEGSVGAGTTIFQRTAVPFANASTGLLGSDSTTLSYNPINRFLSIGTPGFSQTSGLNINGGNLLIYGGGNGVTIATGGGYPTDLSKSISFQNNDSAWAVMYQASTYGELRTKFNGSILPTRSGIYSLGLSTNKWSDLWVTNINGVPYVGGTGTGWSLSGNAGTNTTTQFIGTSDNVGLAFRTNNTIRLNVSASGSVGIGTGNTSDTAFKLFVETGIRTRKVKVDAIAWPDYVFDKDYELPTLPELDKFIQQNKHLPGVQSAPDAEKNGIDLADNQTILLKKVEELTLYLIQMKKENEEMKERIDKLESKNAPKEHSN